jgi:hypothetical protein
MWSSEKVEKCIKIIGHFCKEEVTHFFAPAIGICNYPPPSPRKKQVLFLTLYEDDIFFL